MQEVSVEFTRDELEVVSELLGVSLPVGVSEDDFPLPEDVTVRLHQSARRALEARRVIEGQTVNDAVASVLDLAANPLLVLSVEIEEGPEIDTTFLLCDPDLGVELAEFAPKCYRLTPFVTRDLLARVVRRTDLRPAPSKDEHQLQMSAETLAAAADLAATDVFAAEDLFVAAGIERGSAGTFASALASLRRTVAVTALHKPDDDQVEGGSISWLDCGLDGNWWSEPDDGAETTGSELRVAAISAEAILAEIATYLPEAFSPDSADGGGSPEP